MAIEEILKGEKDNIEYKVDIPSKSENYMRTVVASGTTRKAAIYQIQEMTLSTRNRNFDSEKVERELSEEEMNVFCDRLYHHARELCANEEAKKI